MERLDSRTIDEVFSTFGKDATFALETKFCEIMKDHALRVQVREWLIRNDPSIHRLHAIIENEGILDRASQDEVMVLMMARTLRAMTGVKFTG